MFRLIKNELIKMLVQKRSYIMLLGHVLFMALCYIGLKITPIEKLQLKITMRSDLVFNNFVGLIDGLFFARMVFVPTFIALMPIIVASLAGEIVAGEMQDGSLKLYLARPRNRTSVLVSKLISVFIATLIYSCYFSLVSLVFGIILFGYSPTQLIINSNGQFGATVFVSTFDIGLIRYAWATLYASVALMALGSLALFLSTIFNRMTAATISAVSIYFIMFIFSSLPFAESMKPYLLSELVNNSAIFSLARIPINRLFVNVAILFSYISLLSMSAVVFFNCKDIK